MNIGERIRQRRIELGMSQEELAFKMGYTTRNAIYQFEQKDNMKLSLITDFARALNTTEAYLAGWEDDDQNKSRMVETGLLSGKLISRIGDKLTDNDVEHIIKLMELSPEQRAIVFNQVDYLHSMK